MSIFPPRALLQVNFACFIKDQNVNSAMEQVIPMHLRAARVAENPIVFIDDREGLTLR